MCHASFGETVLVKPVKHVHFSMAMCLALANIIRKEIANSAYGARMST
jgi:hypothetical protein